MSKVYSRQYRILKDAGVDDEQFGPYPKGYGSFFVYKGHVVEMHFGGRISSDIDFTQFPFLIALTFEKCTLKRIPPSIAKIPHLQEFEFHDNIIEECYHTSKNSSFTIKK